MAKHHTKDKGDLGVLKAQADLAEQGYIVLVPLSEHQAFDIVAYKEGVFKRIQVKYRALDRTAGAIQVKLSTCWADRKGTHTSLVCPTSVDVFCVYCPETDECYYFGYPDRGKNFSLRVNAPKNNQAKGIKLATNYRRVP